LGLIVAMEENGSTKKWGGDPNWKQTSFPRFQLTKNIKFVAHPAYLDKQFLQQKYLEEKLGATEIAQLIGSSKTTVLKYLKRFGIPTRKVGANLRNHKNGVAYGQKMEKRELQNHKREQANIDKMKELRANGFSYWKIAEVFNSMKIPTKTGKGKWHAKTVQQILERF
ncbi:MAG: recombinase family protein, partial [Bacteriovoracaceae bacterium]